MNTVVNLVRVSKPNKELYMFPDRTRVTWLLTQCSLKDPLLRWCRSDTPAGTIRPPRLKRQDASFVPWKVVVKISKRLTSVKKGLEMFVGRGRITTTVVACWNDDLRTWLLQHRYRRPSVKRLDAVMSPREVGTRESSREFRVMRGQNPEFAPVGFRVVRD